MEQQQEVPTVQVNLNLLTAMVDIIDLGSSKGIFVGNDMTVVGEIRGAIVRMVNEVQQAQQAQTELPIEETTEE
jgi:hypothetical protein